MQMKKRIKFIKFRFRLRKLQIIRKAKDKQLLKPNSEDTVASKYNSTNY